MCQRPTSEGESDREGGGRGVGMRPVEFHSRRRERRSSSHRAVLSYASRVTGCHAQESLSPRFRLSGRVIVRVTSRRRGETNMYVLVHIRIALRSRLHTIVSMLLSSNSKREQEAQREGRREGGRIDCSGYLRHALCRLRLIDPVNWNNIVDA